MTLEHLVDVRGVVVVVMGEQDVRQLERPTREELEQRLERAACVDHHRVTARLVGHHVSVGDEVVVHRAFDDHNQSVSSPAMSLIHTCYRITDIERSVAFYKALGFDEVRRVPIRDEATNVFMNQPDDGDGPRLELTFNHGQTEPYDLG